MILKRDLTPSSPLPTPPFLCPTQTFLTVFALSQSLHEKFNLIKADNNSERNIQNIQWCNSTTHTVNTHKHGIRCLDEIKKYTFGHFPMLP